MDIIIRKLLRISLYLSLIQVFIISSGQQSDEESQDIQLFITVSSRYKKGLQRRLELNWISKNHTEQEWVGLFGSDPRVNWTEPLDKTQVRNTSGWYLTSITLPYYDFQVKDPDKDLQLKTKCLQFWIGFVRNESVLAAKCFSIYPDWMSELNDTIENFSLHQLFIPGTHDSGSYKKNKPKLPSLDHYTVCQDQNLWNQLVYGVRYFDFRVGYYRKDNEDQFWFNHGAFKVNQINEGIEHIKKFIQNTKEIVVMDFHRFPVGFKDHPGKHKALIHFLIEKLGKYLIPRSYGIHSKIKDLWKNNKRILLMYNNNHYNESDLIWKGLPQIWFKTNSRHQLKRRIEDHMTELHHYYWAAMAELTPNGWDIFTLGSIRTLADDLNHFVTAWFRDEWWDKVNMVATDFFLGNNIIEVAIEANKKRWLHKLSRSNIFLL